MGETGLAGCTNILNPDTTDDGLVGDADLYHKAGIFSFAGMLPVKWFAVHIYNLKQ